MSEQLNNEQFDQLRAVETQLLASEQELSRFVATIRQPLENRLRMLELRWWLSTIISIILFAVVLFLLLR